MDMTEKDLRRLSRPQILEMFATYDAEKTELQGDVKDLVQQIEDLKEQNANLQGRLTEAGAKLNNQKIELEKAGSIADAAMQVNGVFEAAQKAADQYLDSVKALKERQEKELAAIAADSKSTTDRLLKEAQEQADQLQAKSRAQAKQLEEDSRAKSDQILHDANTQAETVKTEADRYALGTRTEADQYAKKSKADADTYAQQVKADADSYAQKSRAEAEQYAADNRAKIAGELSAAQEKKADLEKKTQQNCDAMLAKAKSEAESYWNSLTGRLEGFYQDHAGLKELLGKFDIIKDQSEAKAFQESPADNQETESEKQKNTEANKPE